MAARRAPAFKSNAPMKKLIATLGCSIPAAFVLVSAYAQKAPDVAGTAAEPIRYIGKDQPNPGFFDGRLPHAVGVHRY
jgi:hypothetical protein